MIESYLPFWKQLNDAHRIAIRKAVIDRTLPRGTAFTAQDCEGMVAVREGNIRVYTMSKEGKEITLFSLLAYDVCVFTSPCVFQSSLFDLMLEAEQDSEVYVVPSKVFKALKEQSIPVSNYVNELMLSRFSEVMGIVDQLLDRDMLTRLAVFLYEQFRDHDFAPLHMTQEYIAKQLGSAREVVSRLLARMQKEGMIEKRRGVIVLVDHDLLYSYGKW